MSNEKMKIHNDKIESCMNAVEYSLMQNGFSTLLKPLNCIRNYISKLEADNLGKRQTIKNLEEKVEKYGGWLR